MATSNTEMAEPKLTFPIRDIVDPTRSKFRSDTEAPSALKRSTDRDAPKRLKLRRDSEEPK